MGQMKSKLMEYKNNPQKAIKEIEAEEFESNLGNIKTFPAWKAIKEMLLQKDSK